MIKAATIKEVKDNVREWKKQGLTIGLVPTMGYLHEGHASLIKRARGECDKVIVSDFVNPIQFGPKEDLATYPRDFDADCELCEGLGTDLIFHPEPSEMYLEGFHSYVGVDTLSTELCGKSRPIHFNGVCTVVSKLFNITEADKAYFGQKDAQQLAIVKRMVRDLNFNIEIVGCPIIREESGLAKSSRNTYLSEEEREKALVLHKALTVGEEMVRSGEKDANVVKKAVTDIIESEPLARVDYVEIVDWNELQKVDKIDGPILTAVAVYFGDKVRLIDNFIVEEAVK
ncbi:MULTISPECIES: pantoate--beta-alanine ligase [Pseudobutyrivibrio]|uniref:Pantothenate synthetase n=2 Tax=Pseudobutyrivibrio xylanivorans TaxID=185007 RepID=A0A1M6FRS2_PSEXY|nr:MULTISPECIES: pantoate--beta-alanine ligase [Pseudobutyrivibrio]MDC7280585.1 pantoate--beta-alanine ligase [Butyrivibrio fibrisolvens]SCZ80497.1 pantoate--beta-alanine ligase [Pseudobutyrivibrio xylanivorans]SDI47069.1 pantoate--beta-alanine ligase [Pseudobutyrivibrio sp. 49]SHJ00392.1 pantoate--beta-alanine ligase [Pseudobutyrivibrio xylanivorans DSM 14809]